MLGVSVNGVAHLIEGSMLMSLLTGSGVSVNVIAHLVGFSVNIVTNWA